MTESRKPPIFIVGSPRSGTTMLRSLLSRHPQIAICNETRFFADIYKRRSKFGPLDNPENRRRLIDQYLATARVDRLQMDLDAVRERLLRDATSYPAFFTSLMQCYSDLNGKSRFGEKTPHHSLLTETLCDWYPGAYIVHLVRDPRDVVASLQRMLWSPKSVWNNAWIWLLFNRGAERSSHRPQYMLLRYEDLIDSPQEHLMRICRHVGEEWPESLDVPTDASVPYSWPSSAQGAITKDRVQKWRSQLSPEQLSVIEYVAGERLEKYGYERAGKPASAATLTKAVAAGAVDQARLRLDQLPHTWFYLTQPTNLPLHEYWKFRHAWDTMFPNRPPLIGRK